MMQDLSASPLLARWRRIDFRAVTFFACVLVFFFVSGACGLLYQVVWTRKLVLLFGTTSYAVAAVLSIFFAGLGFGSIWGGRLADRSSNPLRLYGFFEIIIGLWALFFILFVTTGEGVVVSMLRALPPSRALAVGIRGLLAFVLLIVPAGLMGATLPLVARHTARVASSRGFRIGALYSINTFGAVSGCALSGFLLLPALGYLRTTLVGVCANVFVGILALWMARQSYEVEAPGPTVQLAREPRPARFYIVLLAYGLSGLCGLALEVVWTRFLTIIFLGTTYAFTTMLTSLLCGIAAGSAVAATRVDRLKRPVSAFGVLEVLIGISCLGLIAVFAQMPDWFKAMQHEGGSEWGAMVLAKFRISFLALALPNFLFGMTFPCVIKAATGGQHRMGRDVGLLYGANTFGGVVGSFVGGFLLVPYLGTHWTLVTLALVLCANGLLLILCCPNGGVLGKLALAALALVSTAAVWTYLPDDVSRVVNISYMPPGHKAKAFREGVEGTVVVSEEWGDDTGTNRTLWINAVQATATIEKGVKMNRLQGVLPLMFEHEPREALFMCFGSGITAGTLALSPFERIDAVEISRDVLECAPLFETDNLGVLKRENLNVIVDDGRNFLLTTENNYDVITFEPMPLALAGVSAFYTQEYYELCLAHLRPGGVVSQWVPLHSLSPDLVKSLTYTFTTVFPEYCAWFINADLFLIGSNEPLTMDYALAEQRIRRPELAAALDAVELGSMVDLLACYFMGKPAIDQYVRGGRVMRDDRPWAEFIAPKLMYERNVGPALADLIPYYAKDVPAVTWPSEATHERVLLRREANALALNGVRAFYAEGLRGQPWEEFEAALDIDPTDSTARYYLKAVTLGRAAQHVGWNEYDEAVAVLTDALRRLPKAKELYLKLGDVHYEHRAYELAREAYQTYVDLGGKVSRARERLDKAE